MLVDALGNPVELMLTPGQAHDLACAQPLLENADPDALIGNKAYDADPLLDVLTQRSITPVIPPKANRKTQRTCDFALYCERNLVERFSNLLKAASSTASPTYRAVLACDFARSGPKAGGGMRRFEAAS